MRHRAGIGRTGHIGFNEPGSSRTDRRARRITAGPWLPAAAALAAILALVAVVVPWDTVLRPASPGPRSGQHDGIESLVPDGAILPADEFTLRWSPAPEGARYTVRVTDSRLRHVAAGEALVRAEFTVPEEALTGLAAGDIVLWQVEAVLPDGSRVTSRTFSSRLQ